MTSTTQLPLTLPTEPDGPTGRLCNWIATVKQDDIPSDVWERSKYLLLDHIACALTAAHMSASIAAAKVIFSMEPSGTSSVIGWNRNVSPLSAAMLNSSFIQGFELDDWHKEAPLHSGSIIVPALLAAGDHQKHTDPSSRVSGSAFLLASIVGYEVGPRVGLALYGRHILSEGWHSGAVFGPSASAAAVSKLLGLSGGVIEDALGIACTQACGLMSAQFEADVKRMQHGFASRSGLLGAMLASGGYTGIKRVYEREYGGFLKQFSQGNGRTPQYRIDELGKELGSTWQTHGVSCKPYASMAATHGTVDTIAKLQGQHPELFMRENLANIKSIVISLEEPVFHHGGWKATRPLKAIGAQMSNSYVSATQLVDRVVLAAQFKPSALERDEVWDIVNKTTCQIGNEDTLKDGSTTDVHVTLKDGTEVSAGVASQKGVDPPLTNEELVEKWRALAKEVIDDQRREKIERAVLTLDELDDISVLADLLKDETRDPLQ